tara:strand:- start:2152 stop:3033 length:882 start_codon:yes stop_codon:yes gene_type:complete
MPNDIRQPIKTTEEYAEAVAVTYIPQILALPKRERKSLDSGKIISNELTIEVNSVVPTFLTNELTEMNAAKVISKSKSFNAYAKALTFRLKMNPGSSVNAQKFHDQILRPLSIGFDNKSMIGEGGNNALVVSSDANYVTNASEEIPAVTDNGFNQIQKIKQIAMNIKLAVNSFTSSDNLTVYFYGTELLAFLGAITDGQDNDAAYHIRQAFDEKTVNFVQISTLALPTSLGLGSGMIVVSNDLVTLEHCGLPEILRDGVNGEKGYYYANYLVGSMQVVVEELGAIIKQPITFA